MPRVRFTVSPSARVSSQVSSRVRHTGRRPCPSPSPAGRTSHCGAPGGRYRTSRMRWSPVTSWNDAAPFGHRPATRDGRVLVALDVGDPPVLDVDLLPAAHRAVGADGANRRPASADAGPEAAVRSVAAVSPTAQGSLLPQLAKQRPRLEPTDERGHPAIVGSQPSDRQRKRQRARAEVRWAAERGCPPRRRGTRSTRRSPPTTGPGRRIDLVQGVRAEW
jgi:hypothetical protein